MELLTIDPCNGALAKATKIDALDFTDYQKGSADIVCGCHGKHSAETKIIEINEAGKLCYIFEIRSYNCDKRVDLHFYFDARMILLLRDVHPLDFIQCASAPNGGAHVKITIFDDKKMHVLLMFPRLKFNEMVQFYFLCFLLIRLFMF